MSTSATMMVPAEDALLLEQLHAGDGPAFETLVRAYSGRMLASARRLLCQEEEARAAVQEALVSALHALNRYENPGPLGTWLQRLVLKTALGRLRTRQRNAERSIEEFLPKFKEDGRQAQAVVEWRVASEQGAQRQEIRQPVREAIDQLPEAYRTILWLRDIEGLDTEATAQMLELNSALVRTRLHRARQALRGLLDPHFREGAR